MRATRHLIRIDRESSHSPVLVRIHLIELAAVSALGHLLRLLLQLSDLVGGAEEQRDVEQQLQAHYHVQVEEVGQLVIC